MLHAEVFIFSPLGSPARTVGWRDPGFIHTSFLNNLWPNTVYVWKDFFLLLYLVSSSRVLVQY